MKVGGGVQRMCKGWRAGGIQRIMKVGGVFRECMKTGGDIQRMCEGGRAYSEIA